MTDQICKNIKIIFIVFLIIISILLIFIAYKAYSAAAGNGWEAIIEASQLLVIVFVLFVLPFCHGSFIWLLDHYMIDIFLSSNIGFLFKKP